MVFEANMHGSPGIGLSTEIQGKLCIFDAGRYEGWKTEVYPGDRVTNIFVLNQNTMKWHDSYFVTPGLQAHAAGKKIFADGFQFDQDAIAQDSKHMP